MPKIWKQAKKNEELLKKKYLARKQGLGNNNAKLSKRTTLNVVEIKNYISKKSIVNNFTNKEPIPFHKMNEQDQRESMESLLDD